MDLRSYLVAIRRSWWIIVVAVALGAVLGWAKSAVSPNVYQANVGFYISTPDINSQNASNSDQFAQERANSYAQLVSGTAFTDQILPIVKDEHPAFAQQDLTSAQLGRKIVGSASLNTVILEVTVKDTSRDGAFTIAQALATNFPEYVSKIDESTRYQIKLVVYTGPSVQNAPISPRTNLNIAILAFAGLLVGLILAIGRHLLDTSARTADEAGRAVGAPTLAVLGEYRRTSTHPLAASDLGSPHAEELRQLRTNIRFIGATQALKTLVVTSSVPGEGKTTVATNLGLICAESGARVLLIDADLRLPKMADYLALDGSVGLANVLARQVDVDEAIQEWGEHGLKFLPAGSTPPNPSELLGSERMGALLATLRGQYDLIVLDTPPLLPVTDAAVLSEVADGTLFVVRYGKTRRGQISRAARILDGVGSRVIGCVLNMCPPKSGESYGYSGYYSSVADAAPLSIPEQDPTTAVDQLQAR